MKESSASILVVDDESLSRKLLATLLQVQGYRTTCVASGDEAMQSIASEPPDLIILDNMMTKIGGCDVARILKANPGSLDIPIIMVSARSDRSDRLECLSAGAEEFLSKPVDRDELWLRVRNLLRLKSAADLLKNYGAILEERVSSRTADLQLFRSAMDLTPDIVTLVSRDTMRFTEVNAAACALWGRSREEMLAMCPSDFGVESRESLEAQYDAVIRGEGEQSNEMEMRRADGTLLHLEVNRHAVKRGDTWTIVAVSRDITDRKRVAERLRVLAHYDPLTGLPNRRMFRDSLQRAMEGADALKQQVVLMNIDLDDFKNVNDSLGHHAGDDLLREVGNRLLACLYPRDSAGRLGGDEFGVILVAPPDPSTALTVARRIRDAIGEPFEIAGHAVSIAASVGITLYPFDSRDIDELARNADLAMYEAKRAGRGELRFYTAALNDRLRDRLELDKALRVALERGEFALYYQPKVCLQSGKWVGAEALLRWNRPGHGLVPPGVFIAALEETGLISSVGAWVIEEACRQVGAWDAAGLEQMPVAVNVSALQIARPMASMAGGEDNAQVAPGSAQLVEASRRCMAAHGLGEGMLEIEITESVVMADAEHNIAVLRELRSLGVHLSVDDFGTGYSSLAYLRRFPLNAIKIDGSFIQDVTTNAEAASITLAIIEMGHRLGLKVIAECVETCEQAEFLRANGCDQAQGYYFARPIPAVDFEGVWRASAGPAASKSDPATG